MTLPAPNPPHHIAAGAGPGLVFVHGAGGNAASWWQQVEAFAPRYRTVAYDLAGFGRTAARAGADLPHAFVDDALAVLDAAGLDRATFVCQSLGGWTGVRLALAHPDRVERLVLVCTVAGIGHPPGLAAFQAALPKMGDAGPTALALSERFCAAQPAKAYLYAQVSAFNTGLDRDAGMRLFAPDNLVPLDQLAAIRCPVLIIAGQHDPIWPPASLEGLVGHFADARMHIVADTGHSPYFERPEAFNALLADFLQA